MESNGDIRSRQKGIINVLVLKYFLFYEAFFLVIVFMIAGINYFIADHEFSLKAFMYGLLVMQIPICYLTAKFWVNVRRDILKSVKD